MIDGDAGRGFVELTRPVNAVAAGLLTAIGAFVAGGVPETSVPVVAAVLATVLAVGAGNAINDYFDREIDRINAPERPIPRGAVSPRGALAFSVLLFLVAVGVAVTLPVVAIAIAGINLIALVAYTKLFKGTPGLGNVVVGGLTGSTFLFGAAAQGGDITDVGVLALFVLASVSTITREIVKDVEDLEGDREEGLQTLPTVIGRRRALHVGAGLLLCAVLASPAPYLVDEFGGLYLVVVAPAVAMMLYAMWTSYEDPSTGQAYLKLGMFVAALSFVAGRITTVV